MTLGSHVNRSGKWRGFRSDKCHPFRPPLADPLDALRNECSNALMANYFSGPSTAQMRLTVFLIGAAALIGGILISMRRIEAVTTFSPAFGPGGAEIRFCGTPFAPEGSSPGFPRLAEDCYSAIVSWQIPGAILFLVAGVLLVRLLYMLIGPKIPSK